MRRARSEETYISLTKRFMKIGWGPVRPFEGDEIPIRAPPHPWGARGPGSSAGRAPGCGPGGPGFESRPGPHLF